MKLFYLENTKVALGILAWLLFYPILLIFGLQSLVGMSENDVIYFLLLFLFFIPLIWLNFFGIRKLSLSFKSKSKLLKAVFIFVGILFLDALSFGVFLFISFTVFGFGP